jgi:hypothetical protein
MDRYADSVLRQALAKWTATLVGEPEIKALADLGDARQLLQERLLLHAAEETVDTRLRMMCTLFDDSLIACDPHRHPEDPIERRAEDLIDRAALAVSTSARFPLAGNRALPWHDRIRAEMLAIAYPGRSASVDPIVLLRIRRDLVEALTRYAMQRLQDELDLIHLTVLAHLEHVGGLLPTPEEIDMITIGMEARR